MTPLISWSLKCNVPKIKRKMSRVIYVVKSLFTNILNFDYKILF